jgi:flagellar basal-body rod protein FlgB
VTTPVSGASSLFSDLTTDTVQRALDGVSAEQQIDAADLANAATPGYRAQQVNFEDSLANAAQAGDPLGAAITETPTNTPADATGNTVSMTAETTDLTSAGLQYQALTQAMNFRLSLLNTAITS